MLSNKGSVQLSFLITFLIIFLVCGIYCFIMIENGVLSQFIVSNSNEEITEKKEVVNYEETLKEATRKYVNDYYSDLNSGERLIVKLSTLRKYNYISMNSCNGYSIVNKNSSIVIDSYLSCTDYESNNYNKEYE